MKINNETLEIVIGLLESTLGSMPSSEADEVVEACVELLKGRKPKKNNKAKTRYYICRLGKMKWE